MQPCLPSTSATESATDPSPMDRPIVNTQTHYDNYLRIAPLRAPQIVTSPITTIMSIPPRERHWEHHWPTQESDKLLPPRKIQLGQLHSWPQGWGWGAVQDRRPGCSSTSYEGTDLRVSRSRDSWWRYDMSPGKSQGREGRETERQDEEEAI